MENLPIQQSLITEDQIVTPLVHVLNETAPKPLTKQKANTPTLKESLDTLFPEQQYEERDVQKAKEVLGEITQDLTAEELKTTVTEVKYLVSTWLDDFERHVFDGLTLNELLHEKGAK